MSLSDPAIYWSYFQSLFKNTRENTIIIMDDKGIISEINESFTHSFGYERQDIIGCSLAVLRIDADRH
ncbi:MAG: PAS domain S-box protein [Ferruginibacter sp.]